MNDALLSADSARQYDSEGPRSRMSAGSLLIAERQAQGLTVEQVASQLNLAPRQVIALETDDHAALPGMVIVRGFLRAYAKLLRLDAASIIAALNDPHSSAPVSSLRNGASTSASTSFSQSQASSENRGTDGAGFRVGRPLLMGTAIVLIAGAGAYAFGWRLNDLSQGLDFLRARLMRAVDSNSGSGSSMSPSSILASTRQTDEMSTSSPPMDQQVVAPSMLTPSASLTLPGSKKPGQNALLEVKDPLSTPADSPAPVALAATTTLLTAPPSPSPVAQASGTDANSLVLTFQEDSWIELKRDGKHSVLSKMFKAGSVETFEVTQPVTLIIGNIAGVQANLRGVPLKLDSSAKDNVAKFRIK